MYFDITKMLFDCLNLTEHIVKGSDLLFHRVSHPIQVAYIIIQHK